MDFWNSGGDEGDGWDDEDSIGDLSDQPLEADTGNSPDYPSEVTHQPGPQPMPRPTQMSPTGPQGGVALGSGMFMGRLTRFLEAVTQPQEEEEISEEGWNDDSGLSLGLDDADGDVDEHDGGNGWDDDALDIADGQEDPQPLSAVQASSTTPDPLPPPQTDPSKSQLMNSGWDDDLDLTLDDVGSPQAQMETGHISSENHQNLTLDAPLNNNSFLQREAALEDVERPAAVRGRNVSFEQNTMAIKGEGSKLTVENTGSQLLPNTSETINHPESGWDQDETLLNDVDANDTQPKSQPEVEDATNPPESGWDEDDALLEDIEGGETSDSIKKAEAVDVGASGWDDDHALSDVEDEGNPTPQKLSDELELQPLNDSSQTKLVDLTPPPPPPPPSQATNSTVGGISEAATAATETDAESGSNDDLGLPPENPLTSADMGSGGSPRIVDTTPPPPPSETATSTFRGGNSEAAVAASHVGDMGWDDIDEGDDEAAPQESTTRMVDQTPLPPPPPREIGSMFQGGNSTAAVAATKPGESGWEDDDGLFGDEDESKADGSQANPTKIVDHTPLPPPPARFQRSTTMDAVWGGDGDQSQADTLSIATSRAGGALSPIPKGTNVVDLSSMAISDIKEPMVDHTPSLRSGPRNAAETVDATASLVSVDSLSLNEGGVMKQVKEGEVGTDSQGWKDDGELDGVEALHQDETQQPGDGSGPTKLVDHTPSSTGATDAASSIEVSMSSMAVIGAGSSVADSLESFDYKESSKQRISSRKMVDHTPSQSKLFRGVSLDASLAAMGASSVGESLDSIDEADEYREAAANPDERNESATENSKTGWNVESLELEEEKPRSNYAISFQDSMVIPFGTGNPPAALSAERANRSYQQATQVPVVDHTPQQRVPGRSIAESVDALGVSSDEGDLDASRDDVDDVKDDLYGQVVDHTPGTPNAVKGSVSKLLDGSDYAATDDTVRGVAERNDMDADMQQDDEMDESSHGVSTSGTSNPGTQEEHETWSLLGSLRLSIVEEHLVDFVPHGKESRPTDASTLVFGDASEDSSRTDNVSNFDGNITAGYGPIVDHTPNVMPRSARSVATSVVTQASGLETELKLDEELDNTIGPGGSTEDGEDGWDNDGTDLEGTSAQIDEPHVVDHVPTLDEPRPNVDESVRVIHPSDDSTHKDDTIVEDAADDTVADGFGPVVDHTPLDARSVAYSVAASMAPQAGGLDADIKLDDDMDNTMGGVATDRGPGWDHDEPDLEELSAPGGDDQISTAVEEERHLVDHVPQSQPLPRTGDASTMVLYDPLDAVSEVGDDENARSSKFGPVVDQLPPVPQSAQLSVATSVATRATGIETDMKHDDEMDGTWFGTSTAGGASTAAGDGWDDDEELEGLVELTSGPKSNLGSLDEKHVVDHVPDLSVVRPTDMSTGVVVDPSEVSSQRQEDNNDVNIDVGSFGAVVDLIPSEPQPSRSSVTNSMATLVTGLDADIKRDDEMDETWNGGVSTEDDDDGWDHDEPELENLADGNDDEMPHLVDHVPERPESRPTDASTLVVAEPSEMESQVDDFGQEEQNFGPVVDQTPPSQLTLHQSAAGSTIVAPPSVVGDDLDDDAGETAGDTIDNNGWDPEDMENPQSGNEDETREREQLVDYVPPEDEIPELVGDGSSEMATVGEKSVLPADDPKEDEFGPVVDHTPRPASRSPVSDPSERRIRVQEEDSKKTSDGGASALRAMDSVAAQFSVASKEKDDGLDEDEFGPVVDHLPTVSSRSSFPPSRGGSTVDALATVSEVDDDLIDGDGWDEDIEIETGDQVSSIVTNRAGEQSAADDKPLSVKWVDNLSGSASSATRIKTVDTSTQSSTSALNDTQYFDATMGDSTGGSLNATQFHDTETGDGWDDSLNFDTGNVLDDGDDTPPSTPRARKEPKTLDEAERGISTQIDSLGNGLPIPNTAHATGEDSICSACANASSVDCPCVKRILQANSGNNDMLGNLMTPEGECVKVNFGKLIEDEMTKRRLIEKESDALRATVETLKASKKSLVAAGESQMDVINKLHQSNRNLTDDLSRAHEESNELRRSNEELRSEARRLKDGLFEFEAKEAKWRASETSMKREIDQAQKQVQAVTSSAVRDTENREQELRSELERWRISNEDQARLVQEAKTECSGLREEKEKLSMELATARQSLSDLEQQRSDWFTKESALAAEIQHLKSALEKSTMVASPHESLHDQIGTIQTDLAAKTGECVELKAQLDSMQRRLQSSEAENFKYTKEFAKMTKLHDQTKLDLSNQLSASKSESERTKAELERSVSDYRQRLESESTLVANLRVEIESLREEQRQQTAEHANALREQRSRLEKKESELRSIEAKLQHLSEENVKLTSELSRQIQLAKQSESLSVELLSLSREKDVLQEALVESKQNISDLRNELSEHEATASNLASKQDIEIASLKQERERFASDLSSSEQRIQSLTGQLNHLSNQNERIQRQHDDLQAKCSMLESAAKSSLDEGDVSSMRSELEILHQKLDMSSNELHSSREEYNELQRRFVEMQSDLNRLQSSGAATSEESQMLKAQLSEELRRSRSLEVQLESVIGERDLLMSQSRAAENASSDALIEAHRRSEQDARLREQQVASLSAERDQLAHECEQLRDFVRSGNEKMEALEAELLSAEQAMASKDQAIVILKEQQSASRSGLQDLVEEKKMLISSVSKFEEMVQELEGERSHLISLVERHTASDQSLNRELAQVIDERNALVKERDMLEEDNEEMLVQFGLLKEQLDSNEEKMRLMEESMKSRELALDENRRKLENPDQRLETLAGDTSLYNGDVHAPASSQIEGSLHVLSEENSSLKQLVEELTSKNQDIEAELVGLESENQLMSTRVAELERERDQLFSSSQAKETQLSSVIGDIELQCKELDSKCRAQEVAIERLNEQLAHSDSMAQETMALRNRIDYLEQTCSEQHSSLEQKDGNIRDLTYRLQNSGQAPETSAELETLHETIRGMENAATRWRERIRVLESTCETMRQELNATKDELSASQAQNSRMESDCNRAIKANEGLQARLREMELQLADRNSAVERQENDTESLHRRIVELEEELETSKKHQFDTLGRQHDAREIQVERELMTLRQSLLSRDDQISRLKQELTALKEDLKKSRRQLASAEGHVNQLAADLEDAKSKLDQPATSRVLELTRDEAENVEAMRLHIVTLATTLEQSESRRADAIERLEKERQANADSLRRMTDSVKRFYSTLSCSDP